MQIKTFKKSLIINSYTKFLYKKFEIFNFPNKRINSLIIDFLYITVCFIPIGILFMILEIASLKILNSTLISPWQLGFTIYYFLILNKDFYSSRSIGKRSSGFIILDANTDLPANKIQCMLRNTTIIIWPIEIFIISINPNRRIGDYLSRTRVVNSNKITFESTYQEIIRYHSPISYQWLLIAIVLSVVLPSIPEIIKQAIIFY